MRNSAGPKITSYNFCNQLLNQIDLNFVWDSGVCVCVYVSVCNMFILCVFVFDLISVANDDDKEEERESIEEGLEESGRAEESGDDAEEEQGEEPEDEEEEEESESGLDSDASSTDIEDEELLGTITKDGVRNSV